MPWWWISGQAEANPHSDSMKVFAAPFKSNPRSRDFSGSIVTTFFRRTGSGSQKINPVPPVFFMPNENRLSWANFHTKAGSPDWPKGLLIFSLSPMYCRNFLFTFPDRSELMKTFSLGNSKTLFFFFSIIFPSFTKIRFRLCMNIGKWKKATPKNQNKKLSFRAS